MSSTACVASRVGSRRILRSSPWTRDWSVVRSSRGYRQMNHERMTRWMPGSNGGLATTDMADPRLQQEGRTTGIAFEVLVDSRDADSALEFGADLVYLLEEMGIQGVIGGDLYVGAVTSAQFESTRIVQVLLAGGLVTLVASTVLQSPMKGLRIGIGAIAIGAGVDALAGVLVGRSMATAPAVLLGMGFADPGLPHACKRRSRS